jgi:hypothetical protein
MGSTDVLLNKDTAEALRREAGRRMKQAEVTG